MQITLEPLLVMSSSLTPDSELEVQSPEPVSSLVLEWLVNELRARSRSYSAREDIGCAPLDYFSGCNYIEEEIHQTR